MNINQNDVSKIYKAYILDKIPKSRKNCPSTNKIIKAFKSKYSEKEKTKIVDHITNCCFCIHEFDFILQYLRYEKKMTQEISNLLISEKKEHYLRKKSNRKLLSRKMRYFLFLPLFSWKTTSITIGLIIAVFAFVLFKYNKNYNYRGESQPQIKLIQPVNTDYLKSSLIFKWKGQENSDYYVLELYDETLYLIWKSGKSLQNHLTLPEEILKKLKKNKTYFWSVTAFFIDGNNIESRIEDFNLIDNQR